MYKIQGLISKSVNNVETQIERMGQNTSNAANLNTNGYKSVRFEQILNANGYLETVERVDHSQGSLYKTLRNLDVAIEGNGYFPVTTSSGEIMYTRDGMLKIGKDGYLFTNRGELVGDGIKIPPNHKKIEITEDGKVNIYMESNEKFTNVGTIPVVYFDNPEGLKRAEGNNFIATAESGEPKLNKNHGLIRQGFIEHSNVDIYNTIHDVARINTSVLASSKMLQVFDKLYTRGVMLTE